MPVKALLARRAAASRVEVVDGGGRRIVAGRAGPVRRRLRRGRRATARARATTGGDARDERRAGAATACARRYPAPVEVLHGVSLAVRRGRAARGRRPVRLGQVDAAAHHGHARARRRGGVVRVAGHDVARAGATRELAALRAHRIGFVFQQFFLLDGMTRARQRRHRAALRGRAPRPSGASGRARRSTRVGLEHRLDARPGEALGRRAPARGDRPGAASAGRRSCSPTSRPGNLDSRSGAGIIGAAARAATPTARRSS